MLIYLMYPIWLLLMGYNIDGLSVCWSVDLDFKCTDATTGLPVLIFCQNIFLTFFKLN